MSKKFFRVQELKRIEDIEKIPLGSLIEILTKSMRGNVPHLPTWEEITGETPIRNDLIIEEISKVSLFKGMKNRVSGTGRVTRKMFGLSETFSSIAKLKAFKDTDDFILYDKYDLMDADRRFFLISEKPLKPLKISDFLNLCPKSI